MNLGGWQNWLASEAGEIHVVPADDLKPHRLTYLCECSPVVEHPEPGQGSDLVIHNSYDGREKFEMNERMVS